MKISLISFRESCGTARDLCITRIDFKSKFIATREPYFATYARRTRGFEKQGISRNIYEKKKEESGNESDDIKI